MIIFVGNKLKGGFIEEVAANPDINETVSYIEPKHHIMDLMNDILARASSGCSNIIYDTEEFTDEAPVLVEAIVRIKSSNGAEPILLSPTTHINNEIISEAIDKGIKRFINSGTSMTEQKSELIRCITGFYEGEGNERKDIKAIRKAREERKERIGEFKTIAIMGTCHRIGTSTQALQIVKYLQTKGYKACYVEMNNYLYPNMQFSRKEKPEVTYALKTKLAYDYEYEDDALGLVTVEGVDMYYKEDRLSEVAEKGYDFYVYDYGVYTERDFNKASFLKDDIKLIACGANTVELDYTLNILQNISYNKANLIFSFTAENDREEILGLMDEFNAAGRCFFTDYTPNPFVLSSLKLYDDLLQIEQKPDEEEQRKKGLKIPFFNKKRV